MNTDPSGFEPQEKSGHKNCQAKRLADTGLVSSVCPSMHCQKFHCLHVSIWVYPDLAYLQNWNCVNKQSALVVWCRQGIHQKENKDVATANLRSLWPFLILLRRSRLAMELLCYQEVQTITGDPAWYVIYVYMESTMDEKKKVGFPRRAPYALWTREIHWFCPAWKLCFCFLSWPSIEKASLLWIVVWTWSRLWFVMDVIKNGIVFYWFIWVF